MDHNNVLPWYWCAQEGQEALAQVFAAEMNSVWLAHPGHPEIKIEVWTRSEGGLSYWVPPSSSRCCKTLSTCEVFKKYLQNGFKNQWKTSRFELKPSTLPFWRPLHPPKTHMGVINGKLTSRPFLGLNSEPAIICSPLPHPPFSLLYHFFYPVKLRWRSCSHVYVVGHTCNTPKESLLWRRQMWMGLKIPSRKWQVKESNEGNGFLLLN